MLAYVYGLFISFVSLIPTIIAIVIVTMVTGLRLEGDVALLFIAGWFSSIVLGTLVGGTMIDTKIKAMIRNKQLS